MVGRKLAIAERRPCVKVLLAAVHAFTNMGTAMQDLNTIEDQLTRTLGFFPRVDAKASGLFAVNTAILTVGILNVKLPDLAIWYVGTPAAIALVTLVASYVFLYRCNFPDLTGGNSSLLYFAEIQKRTEPVYISEYLAADDDGYRRDMLGQVWHNARILCAKYKAIAAAIRLTLASLVPFGALLAAESYVHAAMPMVEVG